MRVGIFGCVVAALMSLAASAAMAQSSKCADCHFANPDAPRRGHLSDWDRSAHGRQNVGCERCHGGNATSFEKLVAHKGIVGSGDRKSPVHRASLPMTCGTCHAGQLMEFQKSKHFQLLKADDTRGPTCATCHEDVGDTLLSPKSLEGQCNACHGPGKTVPRPERAANARLMLENVREARGQLKQARDLIKQVKDASRKARLSQEAEMVALELKFAVEAGHSFVYDGLQQRVERARTRLAALFDGLTNPGAGVKPAKGASLRPDSLQVRQ